MGHPPPADGPLTDREIALLTVLRDSRGRVLTRTELARRAGLKGVQPRRVDALLVNVRRALDDERLINVRSRGWMLVDGHDSRGGNDRHASDSMPVTLAMPVAHRASVSFGT